MLPGRGCVTDMVLGPAVTLSGKRDRTRRRRRRRADDEPASAGGAGDDPADELEAMSLVEEEATAAAVAAGPCARARAGLAARGGQLFLYGGQLERGSVEVTLSDFYQLGKSRCCNCGWGFIAMPDYWLCNAWDMYLVFGARQPDAPHAPLFSSRLCMDGK